MSGPVPEGGGVGLLKISLDTNIFYDKAEGRAGAEEFERVVTLARSGKIQLFSSATIDFEDQSGAASRIALRLVRQGVLQESPNAGTAREFMPGGPGLHRVNDQQCDRLLRTIWPNEHWKSATDNKRNDVLHLLGHLYNSHDIFLTKDREILRKGRTLKNIFQITAMSPKDLLRNFT